MTELEKLEFSQPLTDIYTDMEYDLMVEIARRLAISGEIIPSDKWRLQKLAEAGELNKKVVEIIAGYTGKQSEQLTETITAAANSVLTELEPSFRELAKEGYISGTSVPVSKTEKQVVKTFRKQAATDLNLVNTVMRYKAKQAYVDLVNKSFDEVQKVADASNRQEILNALGKHTLSVATGGESSQAAVRKCIQEFNRKGIPAFVDAAGRNWSPEAYVSMDIRTTVSNTAHAAVDARCDAYGIDLITIDSHAGARPKCALDQGKVYSRSNQSGVAHDGDGNEVPFYPLSSTSYGQPDGILGINCGHHKYPFIDGVNYQRYFPIDQEKNAARYKEIQEQRRLERRVRETRREIDMLAAAGDKEGAAEAKIQLTERNKEYREYCDKHKLKQNYNRTRVVKNSDKGVTAPKIVDKGNSGVDKSVNGGIINSGAVSGALNPYSEKAQKHAEQYYESVRHMKTDTQKISIATGIKKDKIDKIKNHVFIQEHDLIEGKKRFDPSYDMAQSWQRLINGSFEEKDIVLLKHEYAELRYMEKGYTQNEAHIKASKRYNYAKYCE